MSDDTPFTRGPARRPAPRMNDPVLQWSTGLPTTDRRIYAGWLVATGQQAALDHAMTHAGIGQVTIKHGSGNLVAHWAIPTAKLFVIAAGLQCMAEMKQTHERYGIAFGWRMLPDGRRQSVLRLRAYLHELLHVGMTEPLLVSVKSTLTSDLLAALTTQFEVLDAVDAIRRQQGKPAMNPPFYACSIPLGPGAEVARGSSQTKAITPMVAHIPSPVTKEHILAHWTKREWASLIESHLDQTIAWSMAESAAIAEGSDLIDTE